MISKCQRALKRIRLGASVQKEVNTLTKGLIRLGYGIRGNNRKEQKSIYIYSKSIYSEDYSSMLASLNNGAMSNGADSRLLLFRIQGIDRREASSKQEEMIRWRNSYLHFMSWKVQLLEGSFTLQYYPNQGKIVSTVLWVIWEETPT